MSEEACGHVPPNAGLRSFDNGESNLPTATSSPCASGAGKSSRTDEVVCALIALYSVLWSARALPPSDKARGEAKATLESVPPMLHQCKDMYREKHADSIQACALQCARSRLHCADGAAETRQLGTRNAGLRTVVVHSASPFANGRRLCAKYLPRGLRICR